MRKTPNVKAERYRVRTGPRLSDSKDGNNGAFLVPFRWVKLQCIISDGLGWDHVSISLATQCTPTWEAMCFIKELFFRDDEVVMQLHPARDKYVNVCRNCLHLWRPQSSEIPLPELYMV